MTFEEREYQVEAKKKLDEFLSIVNTSSFLLSLPCGGGKTYTAASWAVEKLDSNPKRRIFWLCHRKELRDQAVSTFESLAQKPVVWDADNKPKKWGRVNVLMIPSSKDIRLNSTSDDVFIVDEAHHLVAPTWKGLLAKANNSKKILLSATPDVLKRKYLFPVNNTFEVTMQDLAGTHLAEPHYERIMTNMKFNLATRIGEFTAKSLSKLNTKDRNKLIYKRWDKYKEKYGKTAIFVSNVQHAKDLYKHFKKEGVDVSYIFGDTKDRDQILADFKAKSPDTQCVLITVNIFVEGVDVPSIRTVFICRPTMSKTLYTQMIGRGTRKSPGKDDFYIVDFVDAIGRHTVDSAFMAKEVLGEDKLPDEVKEIVNLSNVTKAIKEKLDWSDRMIDAEDPAIFKTVIGVYSFASKYSKRKDMPLSGEDFSVLMAVYNELHLIYTQGGNLKEFIKDSYGAVGIRVSQWTAGALDKPVDLKMWNNICWAMVVNFKHNSTQDDGMGFSVEFFDNLKPDTSLLPSYEDLAEETREILEEENLEWKGKVQLLWGKMLKHPGLNNNYPNRPFSAHLEPLSYYNKVLTLLVVEKPKDPKIHMAQWKRKLTPALQDILDDGTAQVAFSYSKTPSHRR